MTYYPRPPQDWWNKHYGSEIKQNKNILDEYFASSECPFMSWDECMKLTKDGLKLIEDVENTKYKVNQDDALKMGALLSISVMVTLQDVVKKNEDLTEDFINTLLVKTMTVKNALMAAYKMGKESK